MRGVLWLVSPIPDHAFFEQPQFERLLGDNFLQVLRLALGIRNPRNSTSNDVTCSFQLLRQLDGAGIAACRKRLGVPRVDDRHVLNGIFNSHHTFPIFAPSRQGVFTMFLPVTFA